MEIKATSFFARPEAITDDSFYLSAEESHHLAKVFRAGVGDIFYAIDGRGLKYRAVVESISAKKVKARIAATIRLENEPHSKITLAIGLCRPAKIDFIIEKGTELGISNFYFFNSENTPLGNDGDGFSSRKLTRWHRLAAAAAKQCLRTVIPEIHPPIKFAELLALKINYDIALMADMGGDSISLSALLNGARREILLVVGPESGFTDQELGFARKAGFKPVKIGPRRLRAETAAIVFSALVMAAAGEL